MKAGRTGADRLKAEAVKKRWAVFKKRTAMIGRGVTFVRRQIVLRKDVMPAHEAGVAVNFGQNGSGGYRPATRIAINQRQLFNRKIDGDGINQEIVRERGQRFHRSAHGEAGGLQNIDLIDLKNVRAAKGPANTALSDDLSQLVTLSGIQNLAVIESANRPIRVQNNRRREDGTKEATATDFIDPRNTLEAALASGAFVGVDATTFNLRHAKGNPRAATEPSRALSGEQPCP